MILCKGRRPKKEVLLEELAKEDLQVLSLAYVYAKNLQMYGEDVTKAICSAIENAAMLDKAYRKGYYDAVNRTKTIIEADKEYDVEVITRGNCMMCGKELDEGLFFCKECEQKQKRRDKE